MVRKFASLIGPLASLISQSISLLCKQCSEGLIATEQGLSTYISIETTLYANACVFDCFHRNSVIVLATGPSCLFVCLCLSLFVLLFPHTCLAYLLYRSTPIIYFLNSFFHLRIFNIHEYILIWVTFKYTTSKFLAGALHRSLFNSPVHILPLILDILSCRFISY